MRTELQIRLFLSKHSYNTIELLKVESILISNEYFDIAKDLLNIICGPTTYYDTAKSFENFLKNDFYITKYTENGIKTYANEAEDIRYEILINHKNDVNISLYGKDEPILNTWCAKSIEVMSSNYLLIDKQIIYDLSSKDIIIQDVKEILDFTQDYNKYIFTKHNNGDYAIYDVTKNDFISVFNEIINYGYLGNNLIIIIRLKKFVNIFNCNSGMHYLGLTKDEVIDSYYQNDKLIITTTNYKKHSFIKVYDGTNNKSSSIIVNKIIINDNGDVFEKMFFGLIKKPISYSE